MHRWSSHQCARALGISLLIFSLAHTPWPQADFHNVRHQDSPGQVCEFHDHLLRWHPDSGLADDVAILHWHWVPPLSDTKESSHSGDRPTLHADLDNWTATTPDASLAIVADGSSRLVLPPLVCLPTLDPVILAHPGDGLRPRPALSLPFSATFARGVSLAAWLQRWSC